jgi:Protein of unknown function (DUF2695)
MSVKETAGESFDDFIESIAPDVLGVLAKSQFFQRLEGLVWPDGPDGRKVCGNAYANTVSLMTADGHSAEDQGEILAVMRSLGGFCDCEIMLNAAPECRVREAYWKAEHAKLASGNQ